MRSTRTATLFLAAALAGLVPTAAAAYEVYLKDGSVLDARAKYQVQNGRAIITLRNGTVSFLSLEQIDIRRTEAANQINYGSAKVMDTPSEPTPPPADDRRQGLSGLIARRGSSLPATPPATAPRGTGAAPQSVSPAKGAAKTAGGFADLGALPRKPFSNLDILTAVQESFRGQGVADVKVQTGTRPDRIFLEVATNSEGSVFQALETSASTLLRLRERFPGKVAALELLMAAPGGERAGQFVLTPELASALAGKKVETSTFFLDNVQY